MLLLHSPTRVCLLACLIVFSPQGVIDLALPPAAAAGPAATAETTAPAPATPLPIAAETEPIELSYLTKDAFFAITAYPSRFLSEPEFVLFPHEVLEAALGQHVGIEPSEVAQMLLIAEMAPDPRDEPSFALVVRLSQSYELDDLFPTLGNEYEKQEIDGRRLLASKDGQNPAIYMPDSNTLIVADEALLNRMLESDTPPDTHLASVLAESNGENDVVAVLEIEQVGELIIDEFSRDLRRLPPPLVRLREIPDLAVAAQFQLNLTGNRPCRLELVTASEQDCEELEGIINDCLDFTQELTIIELEDELDTDDPTQQSAIDYAYRLSNFVLENVRPEREGERLSLTYQPLPGQQTAVVTAGGAMTAAAIPAAIQARKSMRRWQSLNNMRQLGLGMLNYETQHNRFPEAGGDEEDRPGLSWRVHILPYLDQNDLYEQFHLDEPWDSEHNLELVEQMPDIFSSPYGAAPAGHTHYQLVTGEETAFQGGQGPRIQDFQDGISQTALIVEADEPVIWTKPDDWEFDPENPAQGLGTLHKESIFLALFCDCHAQQISSEADPETLEAIFTHDAGDPVEYRQLRP